ncbi:MAG: beta-glucanase precursor [Lentisphaeria bacterium]|nr:beta-glucanase precursor [Lentisphaeria bacterium]
MKMKLVCAFALMFMGFQSMGQDFGDHKSSTLTSKAWGALGAGNPDLAITYVNKCVELYLAEAKKMQGELSEAAPKDTASEYWALNDVGTSLFIKGEAYMKKGDTKKALEAYKQLVNELKFAQCWDEKGWFWKPADAAKQKIVELSFDAE